MATAIILHILAALVWVGGMFFVLLILRPAAASLDLPDRVGLWSRVLGRFMPTVWVAVCLLPATGYWMLDAAFGGPTAGAPHLVIMQILGWLMILLFVQVHFRAYLPMRRMVRELLIPEAGLYIEQIRITIRINLILGLLVIAVAASGRYW